MRDTKRSYLSIPCHWSESIISTVMNVKPVRNIDVSDVYGVMADGGPVGHGRSRNSVVAISKERAVEFRSFLKHNGLRFIYLLNAPFRFEGNAEQKQSLDSYLGWIIEDLDPDAVMIASHELMRYVRAINEQTPIHISTIAGVRNKKDLVKYLDIVPSRVVLHHDTGKELETLLELVQFCLSEGIEIELMATESCLFHCPDRQNHYESLAHGREDKPFHSVCNAKKLSHPREFLMSGGTIRPEDIEIYEDIGIHHFKITGRSKPADWLPDVVRAYKIREYRGNLIRLLGIDPLIHAEDWIYIENSALSGFTKELLGAKSHREKIACAERWITKLYASGQFKLLDGSEYVNKGNYLDLLSCGRMSDSIINCSQQESDQSIHPG